MIVHFCSTLESACHSHPFNVQHHTPHFQQGQEGVLTGLKKHSYRLTRNLLIQHEVHQQPYPVTLSKTRPLLTGSLFLCSEGLIIEHYSTCLFQEQIKIIVHYLRTQPSLKCNGRNSKELQELGLSIFISIFVAFTLAEEHPQPQWHIYLPHWHEV